MSWNPNNSVRASCHPDRPHAARGMCKSCYKKALPGYKERKQRQKARRRKWLRANDPAWCARELARKRSAKFNISIEEQRLLLERQGGRCAICSDELGGKWHVDHDHATGHIRGFLCHGCNIGIGHLRDSPVILRAAASYLEGPPGADLGVRVRPDATSRDGEAVTGQAAQMVLL